VRGQSILEKAKKEPKGQTKILGQASVIWDQISDIGPQKNKPGNPAFMHDNHTAVQSSWQNDPWHNIRS